MPRISLSLVENSTRPPHACFFCRETSLPGAGPHQQWKNNSTTSSRPGPALRRRRARTRQVYVTCGASEATPAAAAAAFSRFTLVCRSSKFFCNSSTIRRTCWLFSRAGTPTPPHTCARHTHTHTHTHKHKHTHTHTHTQPHNPTNTHTEEEIDLLHFWYHFRTRLPINSKVLWRLAARLGRTSRGYVL